MAFGRTEESVTAVRYLNIVELIIINEELIGKKSQLRDVDLLEAAVLRPTTSAFGEDAYPTILDKAAALFHSLARNHAFVDGNKRTAAVALLVFLQLNQIETTWNAEDALQFILDAATGKHEIPAISAWLAANTRKLM